MKGANKVGTGLTPVRVERSKTWDLEFHNDHITYKSYPLFTSSLVNHPVVDASIIGEIDPDGAPPTLRLKSELLFVPAPRQEELRRFAARNGIPIRRRFDARMFILEPFLDTEFDEIQKEKTLAALEAHGVGRSEVKQIRMRVGRRMLWYTTMTWEWVYYGLFDVLTVMQPLLSGRASYRRFYSEAMEVALRSYR